MVAHLILHNIIMLTWNFVYILIVLIMCLLAEQKSILNARPLSLSVIEWQTPTTCSARGGIDTKERVHDLKHRKNTNLRIGSGFN